MADLGVVPSEHSSGSNQSRGGITKTSNGHSQVLIEAAWRYRHPARKSNVIQRRAERTPRVVQDKSMESVNPFVLTLSAT
jgi:transposase